MKFHSAKSLVASRRNLGLRGASYCNHCGILVPDDFQESHLKERHGIVSNGGSDYGNKIK
jgi:hypothetical protein